jgi:hypothetical protein
MTTHCIEQQPQRSLWAGFKLRWPRAHKEKLVHQLQARASLRHLSTHIQRDIGLFNDADSYRHRFTRW